MQVYVVGRVRLQNFFKIHYNKNLMELACLICIREYWLVIFFWHVYGRPIYFIRSITYMSSRQLERLKSAKFLNQMS